MIFARSGDGLTWGGWQASAVSPSVFSLGKSAKPAMGWPEVKARRKRI
jgi:hypothetical protein